MAGRAGYGAKCRTSRPPRPVPRIACALAIGAALAFATGPARPGPAGETENSDPTPASSLVALLHGEALFAVVAEEGAQYGRAIGQAMFPGETAPGWDEAVARIYAPQALQERFEQALNAALAQRPEVLSEAAAFLGSPLGSQITTLEIDARRALLDDATAEAAAVAAERMKETRDPRLRHFDRLAVAGNLVEENTAAALSGLLAFESGLQAAADPAMRLTADELARDIALREAAVRAQTADWLGAFMALAYEGLDDADLDAYATFAESSAGRVLNAALFAAYTAALMPALHDLGLEAGRVLNGTPI